MVEKVVVLQSCAFETFFFAPDPQDPKIDQLRPVEHLDALTADGLLLASLGSSSARLLHTFARERGWDLQNVELQLQYENGLSDGLISEEIDFYGALSPAESDELLNVAQDCSIHKMLREGLAGKPMLGRQKT